MRAQNLTRHELKTIITRIGEDSKLILGDIERIDNAYVDETSNGLTYAVEKFKEHALGGHVTFTKGERSAVATLAADIMIPVREKKEIMFCNRIPVML